MDFVMTLHGPRPASMAAAAARAFAAGARDALPLVLATRAARTRARVVPFQRIVEGTALRLLDGMKHRQKIAHRDMVKSVHADKNSCKLRTISQRPRHACMRVEKLNYRVIERERTL